ncbi:MAG: hypothetical protein K9K66_03735 [Desulfarculaceae bacterium]|nr:hypothetical protein [Desulfarculaceae bacterium]MCF8072957.1 hypothetical protein [Desulfarculaceae bacterium]MCF8100747.1 hypothetical protein [Desulfarculaceae bacterium]MCF8115485.1 hypothetical protein [Desulfarculaceae bacterium]
MLKPLVTILTLLMTLVLAPFPAPAKTTHLRKYKPKAVPSRDQPCRAGGVLVRNQLGKYCLSCPRGTRLYRGVGTKNGQRRYYYYCAKCPSGYSMKKINKKIVCWKPDPVGGCYGFFRGNWHMVYNDCKKKAGNFKLSVHRDQSGHVYGKIVRLSGKPGCSLNRTGKWRCNSRGPKSGPTDYKISIKFDGGTPFWAVGHPGQREAKGRHSISGITFKMKR